MISFISGRLAEVLENGIIIENQGIGFEVSMPSSSAAFAAAPGSQLTVYTYMAVREDDISLYGFDDRQSLAMFRLLTGVSGIGAKGALAILSALTVNEIKKAIVFEDSGTLSKAQGIGKKTAQRIVLELRDKVDAAGLTDDPAGGRLSPAASGGGAADAIEALVGLGYSKSEAAEAVASSGLSEGSPEDYIKAALKKLSLF